jgi:hypothetical protein
MHGSTWTSFPVTDPKSIKYGMLNWKLALNSPIPVALHGQRLRPINKAVGLSNLKPRARKSPPNKRLKVNNTDLAVKCSPLSNIEITN